MGQKKSSKKSSENEEKESVLKKFSGMNVTVIAVIIVAVVIIMLAVIFQSLILGIVENISNFFTELRSAAIEIGSKGKIAASMPTYVLNQDQVDKLRETLENNGIDTEVCGLTEIRLRKIILAHAVSTSMSDTLCAITVTEEEILENVKEKEKYRDIDELDDFLDDPKKEEKSKDVWPITTPNYKLYYDSDKFFYFQDTNLVLGGTDPNQWYLGAMGATTITAEDGTEFVYCDATEFERIKNEYELLDDEDKLGSTEEENLLKAYTQVNADTIKVYSLNTISKKYEYSFKNKNITNINLSGQDENDTYTPIASEFKLSDKVDMSAYAIPIELIVDLLDITGSGEFIEEFIDYALEKIYVKVVAYPTISTEYKYNKSTYEIADGFTLEMYDFVDLGIDAGSDNFKAYKDIAYGRQYSGLPFEKVTDLADLETINYHGQAYGTEGATYDVSAFSTYLKTAYNPGVGFDLGTVNVTEIITEVNKFNSWEFTQSEVKTWYGTVQYSKPEVETIYLVDTIETTKTEYDNFNHDSLTEYTQPSNETKNVIFMSQQVADQGNITSTSESLHIIPSQDIYDDTLNTKVGKENKSHYRNWTTQGLARIAINDGASKYNDSIGAGTGTDFIYSKYTKTNIKDYSIKTKSESEILNRSNITATNSNIETEARNFLELLKNSSGEIPENPGDKGGFDSEGEVVKYGDVYKGHIPVGDLLLDNGALMFFDLLESTENTQELVNIFKYLSHLYTGEDYGIKDWSLILGDGTLASIPLTGESGGSYSGFWWPIGSETTETKDGKLYASGTPALGKSNVSRAGLPSSDYNGYYGTHEKDAGAAVDIAGNGITNKWNIISIGKGTVIETGDGIVDDVRSSSAAYNYGMGNYIKVNYGSGITAVYMHLYKGSLKVKKGDVVDYGQVLAKMGNSGNSSGVHLHLEIKLNGAVVDTTEYVNPDNPRPVATTIAAKGNLTPELYAMLSYFEGGRSHMTADGDYIIFNNGIDTNYELTCGIAVGSFSYGSYYKEIVPNPLSIGQIVSKEKYGQIFEIVCEQKWQYIYNACTKYGVTLNKNQRDAVFLFVYNMSNGQKAANNAMKAYKTGGAEAYYQYTKDVSISAVQSRRDKEYDLFVNGNYIS